MLAIQISNPKIILERDLNDSNIEEAIQTIFPLENEFAFIVWDHIFVPITYKYDVSLLIKDLKLIYLFSIDKSSKILTVNWVSNTFSARWELSRELGNIYIKSDWLSVLGRLDSILKLHDTICVEDQKLSFEIKKMIDFVSGSLFKAGYKEIANDLLLDINT